MNNKYRERAKKLYNKQIDKWTVGEYIGEGKSAFVCEAYCRRRKYAIKIYLDEIIERSKEGEIENRIQRQLALIKHKHNNLIKIYGGGFCHINKCYYLVMECTNNKNLADVIQKIPRDKIGPIISQVTDAAKFLEGLKLVHRDIKPENISISSNYKATLLDLGVIRPISIEGGISDSPNDVQFLGTLQYSSPEFLIRREEDTIEGWRALTFYQLGAVLHDMIMRNTIFHDSLQPYGRLVNAVLHDIPVIYAEDVEPEIIELAKLCLVKDPKLRYKFISWEDFEFPKIQTDELEQITKRIKNREDYSLINNPTIYNYNDSYKRVYEQFLFDTKEFLINEIRMTCIGNTLFPPVKIDDKLAENMLSIYINFEASKKHALTKKFAIIFIIDIVDIDTKFIELQCGGAIYCKSINFDNPSGLSSAFMGIFDKNIVKTKINTIIHLLLDEAQSKCNINTSQDHQHSIEWLILNS